MELLINQKKLYLKSKNYIDDFNKLLNELIALKEIKISAKGNPPMPLVILKLKSYAQASLHRIIDLSIESCNAWEKGIPAVSFLLTRSALEIASYIFDFTNQVDQLIEERKFEEINDMIHKIMYGERKSSELPVIDNVLNVMDRISKIIPLYRSNYESLSSFCHPNYSAIGMLYSKQNMEEFYFEIDRKFGVREDTFNMVILSLYKSFELQKLSLNRLDIIYPKLEELDRIEYKKLNRR